MSFRPALPATLLACLLLALIASGRAAPPAPRTTEAPATTPSEGAASAATASATGTPAATPSSAASTPTATASPTATTTPTPAAFTVQVQPTEVARGETLLVRVAGASAGVVRTAAGTSVALQSSADGGAWAVVGIGLYADYGRATLSVTARDAQGKPIGSAATAAYTVIDPKRPADYLVVTEETAAILTPDAATIENSLRAVQFSAFDATPRWSAPFRYPLANFEVSTLFGSGRSINGGPVGDFHTGEDLAADEGVPVLAPAPGRVAWVGEMPIRGNSVILDHGGGVMTGYHHLHDINVAMGQTLEVGALIGHVGSTGFATGPHLHWELTIYGINVDPATWTRRLFPTR